MGNPIKSLTVRYAPCMCQGEGWGKHQLGLSLLWMLTVFYK